MTNISPEKDVPTGSVAEPGSESLKSNLSAKVTISSGIIHLITGSVVLFSGFLLIKPLLEPVTSDSSCFVSLVYSILGYPGGHYFSLASGEGIWHPLLYVLLLTGISVLFGPQLLWFRLFGVLCLLIDLLLMGKIARLISKNRNQSRLFAMVSWIIFLLIPYTTKGGVHIDIDTSILPPLMLSCVYVFLKYEAASELKHRFGFALLLCFLFSIALWSKLTTPLLIPAAVMFYRLFQKRIARAFGEPLMITVAGGAVFIVSWYLFCLYTGLPFLHVFQRIAGVLGDKTVGGGGAIVEKGRCAAVTVFAFNPLFLAVWLFLIIKTFWNVKKRNVHPGILFTGILTVLMYAGYLVIGGLPYGVPKYHYPLLPFMALFVAGNLSYSAIIYKNRSLLWGITAGIIITGLYILLPDPLYLLNYKTKAAYLSGLPIKPVLVSTCIVLIAYIVPLAVALITQFTRFKNCVPGIIAVSIAGQMIGFGIHQAFAPYMIVYNYGNRGVPETFDCIAGLDNFYIGEGSVMMPVRQCRAVRVDNIKSDLREFKGWPGYIKNAKPQAVVAGPAFCSAGQMKNIFDTPGFGSLMEKDYRRCQFHDCIVYKRISP